jgi:hypothetical protein
MSRFCLIPLVVSSTLDVESSSAELFCCWSAELGFVIRSDSRRNVCWGSPFLAVLRPLSDGSLFSTPARIVAKQKYELAMQKAYIVQQLY